MTEVKQQNTDGKIIAAFVMLSIVGAATFLIQPLFLGAAAETLNFSSVEIGQLGGIELTGTALASILGVFWIRRFSLYKVALLSLIIIVIGNLVSITQTEFGNLALVRFLTAFFGEGPLFSLALAGLAWTKIPERSFGIAVVGQVAFSVLALAILPWLVSLYGMPAVFSLLIAIAVLATPALIVLRNYQRPEDLASTLSDGEQDSDGWMIILPFLGLIIQVVWYLGVGAVWAYIERIGASAEIEATSIGLTLAFGTGASIVGALLASFIGGNARRSLMFGLALIGQIGALIFLDLNVSLFAFGILVIAYNFWWNFGEPFLLGAIAAADRSGRFSVLITAAQGIGLALGPFAGSLLIEDFSLYSINLIGITSCVISLGLLLLLSGLMKKQNSQSIEQMEVRDD